MPFKVPAKIEKYRVKDSPFDSPCGETYGAFFIPYKLGSGAPIRVIISDGEGWEHVSASLPKRCPTWNEMCFLKNLFWDDEDCVVQFHPPKSEYVNNSNYCLHLWRPTDQDIPLPNSILVGFKD